MMGKKRRKNRPSQSKKSKTIKILLTISVFSAIITILMISEDVVSPNQGSIGLVAVLSLIFLFLGKVGENTSNKRRPKTRDISQTTTRDISSESSGGLTIEATSPSVDDASTPIASSKPQQVRAARRKREYVSYPNVVGKN